MVEFSHSAHSTPVIPDPIRKGRSAGLCRTTRKAEHTSSISSPPSARLLFVSLSHIAAPLFRFASYSPLFSYASARQGYLFLRSCRVSYPPSRTQVLGPETEAERDVDAALDAIISQRRCYRRCYLEAFDTVQLVIQRNMDAVHTLSSDATAVCIQSGCWSDAAAAHGP